jgi:peroxin-7
VEVFSYETQDGLYDLAWSEVHESQIITASGDGSLKLWDVTLNVSTHIRSSPPRLSAGESKRDKCL